MKEIYLYLLTVPIFFGIDMLWLAVIAKTMIQNQIGQFLRPTPNWAVAIIFYLVYIIGIIVFAVLPNLEKGALRTLLYGGLLGMIAYATYDLTNYSTLKDWPLTMTIVDIIWGTILTGTVALISYYIAKWILHM